MVGSLDTSFGREHVLCKKCGKSTRDAVLDRPQRCGCTYAEEVARTANLDAASLRDRFAMGSMGLTGEAGEVCDLLKKHLFHGNPLDRVALIKELGDVRWYLEYLALTVEISMREIEDQNVFKLRKRYPGGFSSEAASARIDVANLQFPKDQTTMDQVRREDAYCGCSACEADRMFDK